MHIYWCSVSKMQTNGGTQSREAAMEVFLQRFKTLYLTMFETRNLRVYLIETSNIINTVDKLDANNIYEV
jgi:hypothetical protein